MPMNETIRAKRKALGLTQEQVAEYLGVSAPAVNKWEKGSTCPDITLLPPLARLLQTDVNTLLGFHERLSPRERSSVQQAVMETVKREGIPKGFEQAMKKVREYPGDGALLHEMATLLDGALGLFGVALADKASYEEQILALYRRAVDCADGAHRDAACFMLACKYIATGEDDRAQEMIDRLPEWTNLDKRQMQVALLLKQGKPEEAARLQECRLREAVNGLQMNLMGMVSVELQREDRGAAARFAEVHREFAQLFGMAEVSLLAAPFEVAVAQRDTAGSLALLREMLCAMERPWRQDKSLLFRYVTVPERPADETMGKTFLPILLAALEQEKQYDFLREEPEFQRLLQEHGGGAAAPQGEACL